jgi:hypothetical protein
MIVPAPKTIEIDAGGKEYRSDASYRIYLAGMVTDKVRFAAEYFIRRVKENHNLTFRIDENPGANPPAENDIRIVNHSQKDPPPTGVGSEDLAVFQSPLGKEQGYIIRSQAGSPVLLYAENDLGCLYAAVSGVQWLEKKHDTTILPQGVIRDYPDFRFRANNWLIMTELGGWSYDWGDGPHAFLDRIRRKLDFAMACKINTIIFDGIGWDADRFPGYAELMRECNREARKRGIHLMHTGYGSFYGVAFSGDKYKGKVFMNRKSYPDGEIYPCVGAKVDEDDARAWGRCSGTCLSNETLMKLKQEELIRFVTEVEPGALYLHNLDRGCFNNIREQHVWTSRCPECRKRWPNDDITAEDGMAGAFAHLYDSLAQCVKQVKKPGYDADRDCLLLMVSPGYTMPYDQDEDWVTALDYWSALSRAMAIKKNIIFTFREQFFNHDKNTARCEEMQQALVAKGRGHEMGIIYFYGADGAYNDRLFIPVPVLNYVYKGASMLAPASGHGYQEPLQLLNAEYLWNAGADHFYPSHDRPQNYSDFRQRFFDFQHEQIRPEELYGQQGFLASACDHLYGPSAGPAMYKLFSLRGKDNEYPVPFLSNMEIFTGANMAHPLDWDIDLPRDQIGKIRARLINVHEITSRARDLVQNLLNDGGLSGSVLSDIQWYGESLSIASCATKLLCDYAALYEMAADCLCDTNRSPAEREKTLARMQLFMKELESAKTVMLRPDRVPLDYFGGALCGRTQLLDFFSGNISKMKLSLADNKRFLASPRKYFPWWEGEH